MKRAKEETAGIGSLAKQAAKDAVREADQALRDTDAGRELAEALDEAEALLRLLRSRGGPATRPGRIASRVLPTTPDRLDRKWIFSTGRWWLSAPAVGPDGTIYVGSADQALHALRPDGTRKWAFRTGGAVLHAGPSIGPDGTVYFGSIDGHLYAVQADGSLRWKMELGQVSGIALAADGTIYISVSALNGRLHAVTPGGTTRWTFQAEGNLLAPAAVAADGTVYVGCEDKTLYAIDPDGKQKWTFKALAAIAATPAIGSDGTVYIGSDDERLYAVDPLGSPRWIFRTGERIQASPAIGPDGTVYIGSADGNLYAINPDGTQRWEYHTSKPDAAANGILAAPAIDADGVIYIGSTDGSFFALSPDGQLLGMHTVTGRIDQGAAIAPDGTIYIASAAGQLTALHGTAPLAESPWPMFQHDPQHTGRAGAGPLHEKAGRPGTVIDTSQLEHLRDRSRQQLERLMEQARRLTRPTPTNIAIFTHADKAVQLLEKQTQDLAARRAKLLERFGPDHEAVQDVASELQQVLKQLDDLRAQRMAEYRRQVSEHLRQEILRATAALEDLERQPDSVAAPDGSAASRPAG